MLKNSENMMKYSKKTLLFFTRHLYQIGRAECMPVVAGRFFIISGLPANPSVVAIQIVCIGFGRGGKNSLWINDITQHLGSVYFYSNLKLSRKIYGCLTMMVDDFYSVAKLEKIQKNSFNYTHNI